MKCNQSRPGFELMSLCPFPMTITITPRAPPKLLITSLLLYSVSITMEDDDNSSNILRDKNVNCSCINEFIFPSVTFSVSRSRVY